MARRRRSPPALLTLHDAAAAVGLSVPTLRRHIRSGRLRAERIRGKYGPEYRVDARALAVLGLPVTLPPRRSPAIAPPRRHAGVESDALARLLAELGALRQELRDLRRALAELTARLPGAEPGRSGRARRR
ncbi:MAG TPA: hypothetical protein VF406_14230 [Thermodesulfobacteriota bacterium]